MTQAIQMRKFLKRYKWHGLTKQERADEKERVTRLKKECSELKQFAESEEFKYEKCLDEIKHILSCLLDGSATSEQVLRMKELHYLRRFYEGKFETPEAPLPKPRWERRRNQREARLNKVGARCPRCGTPVFGSRSWCLKIRSSPMCRSCWFKLSDEDKRDLWIDELTVRMNEPRRLTGMIVGIMRKGKTRKEAIEWLIDNVDQARRMIVMSLLQEDELIAYLFPQASEEDVIWLRQVGWEDERKGLMYGLKRDELNHKTKLSEFLEGLKG